MLAERIDVEADDAAIGPTDLLRFEIHRHRRICAPARVVHQLIDLLLRQLDRQDAVLEAVVEENVGEIGSDDATEAEVQQRPRRMLARRPAAEILARNQDFGVAVGWLVEHEIGLLVAGLIVAQLVEQRLAEARPLDRLQELLRDDHVGIHVPERERGRDAGELGEILHEMSRRPDFVIANSVVWDTSASNASETLKP